MAVKFSRTEDCSRELGLCETMLNNMARSIEDAIGKELWERCSREVFEGGNSGWSMVARLAIREIREERDEYKARNAELLEAIYHIYQLSKPYC